MKRKDLLKCLLITLFFIGLIKIPFWRFISHDREHVSMNAQLLDVLIKVGLIVAITFLIARKNELLETGAFRKGESKNYWMLLLPLVFPGLFPISTIAGDGIIIPPYFLATIVIFLLKGISEEVIFRGVIQGHLLKNNPKLSYWIIAIITSSFFSAWHLGNLTSTDLRPVLLQVVYAFFMGMLFSAVVFKARNVWLAGISHGILNILFEIQNTAMPESANSTDAVNLSGFLLKLVLMALMFSPTLLIFWLLMGRSKRRAVGSTQS